MEFTLEDRIQTIADGEISFSNMQLALDEVDGNAELFERVRGAITSGLRKRVADIERHIAEKGPEEGERYVEFMTRHRDRYAQALADVEAGRDAKIVDSLVAGIVIPASIANNTFDRRMAFADLV